MLTVIMTKLDHFSRNACLGIPLLKYPKKEPSTRRVSAIMTILKGVNRDIREVTGLAA
jgi:hypothetical protein